MARIDGRLSKGIGLLIVAVVVGVVLGRPAPAPSLPETVTALPTPSEGPADVIVVHVSGQVVAAGLVEVPAGARVADVIAAAGGVTPKADLSRVNLAEPVVDGEQVVVGSSDAPPVQGSAESGSDARVRINDADAAELESLPGVGPVLAEAILSYRTEYGSFRSVEDLLGVPGIGEQKLASLRDRVIVP